MAREVMDRSKTGPATSLLALAVGAVAFGALAIGVVVGRLVNKKARFGALEVDELTARKLRVVEYDGPRS
jgi:hypothetical protein